ncbi:hypothetical protein ACXYMX_10925 [Sporosarcina sp. CAU 1771]
MKLKEFLAGVLTGVAAGIVVKEALDCAIQNISPDTVLKNVKESFIKEGPIDGSWIVMKTEAYTNNVIEMNVYRGGISRIKNGKLEQFEFVADASTGTVVEMTKS